ncbi:MAG TPA: hypothetical protein VLA13_03160 [Massilibacterium sp.]|nr:hypothetical protein [Massilibacterium sp.]
MARITPIRIREVDKQEYQRLVRNTRAKIRRVEKNYGVDISDEVNIPTLESFQTRKQFNEWKQDMQSFTNRHNLNYQYQKNKYGVVASKAQLNKIERDTRRAIYLAEERKKEMENRPFYQGGEQVSTVGQRMQHMKDPDIPGTYAPEPFDFDQVKTQQRVSDLLRSRERMADPEDYDKKREQMKDNFTTMLAKNFNSDADELIDKISKMSSKDFLDLYSQHAEFDFDVYYLASEMDLEASSYMNDLNAMESYVDAYIEGNSKYGTDLKDF